METRTLKKETMNQLKEIKTAAKDLSEAKDRKQLKRHFTFRKQLEIHYFRRETYNRLIINNYENKPLKKQ